MTAAWDDFDKIYCISLAHRTDRREEAMRQFAAVGLAGKVEFLVVEKDSDDPERGCYNSHLTCLRKGLEAGAELILVFEDDIFFSGFSPEKLAGASDFCRSHRRFQILFLGCLVRGSRRTNYHGIRNISYGCMTHAYVIPRRFAEVLVRHPWRKIAYDDFLRTFSKGEIYAFCPSFAFQSNSKTDNHAWQWLDRVRRLLGGIRRIQKMNEFYHRWRPWVIGAHVLVLLLLVWAVL